MSWNSLKLLKLKLFGSIFFIIFFSSMISACSPLSIRDGKEIKPITKTNFIMGSLVKITVYDEDIDESVFSQVFNRIQEIENKMTINKVTPQGEIIKLNNSAGHDFVELSGETFFILEKGKYYGEITQGKFDITIGPIVKLWNIDTENAAIPDGEEIIQKLPLVDYRKLELDQEQKKAKLSEEGMMVDLGAIAKGYAADEAAKILIDAGIKHAIINLGGNILTIGSKPDGSLFRLGLQDPFQERNINMAVVRLNNQSLVSSGTYEKFFEANGKKYHHIIDPKTGYPVENELVSVSIITEKSIDADALSTSVFLLGLEKGMDLVEKLPNTEAVFVTSAKKVFVSSGINKDIFELVNEDYQLELKR
ncbi:MAG: FAD:protein FMN transferase [Bacillota bacterium]